MGVSEVHFLDQNDGIAPVCQCPLVKFVIMIRLQVEKFVQANTQELGKDKWLCPLSGKKFKGPDFVRKHIFNKHGEKVR